ncbi:MAG: alanine dehydrogenase [Bacteroidota bacterium]|nr:MAG: alanine dehydrogenase [Bacteroidota bacterium]
MLKLGLIKEGKIPNDKRVALTPKQCRRLREIYPKIQIMIEPSASRSFMDEEYDEQCFVLNENMEECDVLIGIKEVPVKSLIEGKTYLFFSHCAKKQERNKDLLKAVLKKNIRLIDFELLTDKQGRRLVGFGRFAGLVGTYNAMRGYCIRYKMPEPKPAHTLNSLKELFLQAHKIKLPPIKIAFTGEGRVAGGVLEILQNMKIKQVTVEEYLAKELFEEPVFVQLKPADYYQPKKGGAFDFNHFVQNPEEYSGNFKRFCNTTDMFISSAYWDPRSPVLFTAEEMTEPSFRIRIIADITCDIQGSIPSTLRSAIIEDPFYGYNPFTRKEELAFTKPTNITVMAVDNLPNELPRDASEEFGNSLIEKIFPFFFEEDKDGIIERATITRNGALTSRFEYLNDWLNS